MRPRKYKFKAVWVVPDEEDIGKLRGSSLRSYERGIVYGRAMGEANRKYFWSPAGQRMCKGDWITFGEHAYNYWGDRPESGPLVFSVLYEEAEEDAFALAGEATGTKKWYREWAKWAEISGEQITRAFRIGWMDGFALGLGVLEEEDIFSADPEKYRGYGGRGG